MLSCNWFASIEFFSYLVPQLLPLSISKDKPFPHFTNLSLINQSCVVEARSCVAEALLISFSQLHFSNHNLFHFSHAMSRHFIQCWFVRTCFAQRCGVRHQMRVFAKLSWSRVFPNLKGDVRALLSPALHLWIHSRNLKLSHNIMNAFLYYYSILNIIKSCDKASKQRENGKTKNFGDY